MPQKGHSITTRVSKNIIFARLILGDMCSHHSLRHWQPLSESSVGYWFAEV